MSFPLPNYHVPIQVRQPKDITMIEEKALNLLARNISQVDVARACGVDESRISQLMADEEFRKKLTDMKFARYGEQAKLDENYDAMESKLQEQYIKLLPTLHKPRDVLEAMKVINAMKRRSGEATETDNEGTKVATLTIPIAIINKFNIKIDPENQRVIETNGQPLLTAQSSQVVDANEIRSKIKRSAVGAIDL